MARYIDAATAIIYVSEFVCEEMKKIPTADLTPCDVCAYNPPSSCDGKPCTVCPAIGKI